jgi:hypothetical protein
LGKKKQNRRPEMPRKEYIPVKRNTAEIITGVWIFVDGLSTPKLVNFTTDGFLKTTGGDGTLTVDAGGGGGAPVDGAYITIGNTAGLTAERALTGTANQITVTDNGVDSTVVLSTPQSIATTSSPQFANLKITNGGHIYPSANSTTAISIAQADLTPFATFDTTNGCFLIDQQTATGYAISITSGASNTFEGVNTAALAVGSGPFFQFHVTGTPSAADQRLGGFAFGKQAGPINAVAMSTFSAEAWTSSARGAYIDWETMSIGSIIRTKKMRLTANGCLAMGLLSATAIVHIKAGTATAGTAPLKFTSGTSLTTAEAGAVEFTTDDLFFTITTGAARKGIVLDNGARLTSGKIPVATTNGRLIDSSGISATIPIAPVAPLTVAGSATFTNGILTAYTAPS